MKNKSSNKTRNYTGPYRVLISWVLVLTLTNLFFFESTFAQQQAISSELLKQQVSTKRPLSTPRASINSRVLTPGQAACYTNPHPGLIAAVNAAATEIVDRNDITRISGYSQHILFFSAVDALSVDPTIVDNAKSTFEKEIDITRLREQTRETNKQIGANDSSQGTTSAIERPGFAELLGFAIENGAVTKTVNGTTLTLSTSPYAFAVANAHEDSAKVYKKHGDLSRLGVSATFNIANEDNILTNVSRKQLSEWNARLRLSGDRSNRSEAAEDIWVHDVSAAFAAPDNAITGAHAALFRNQELETKRREVMNKLSTIGSVSTTLADNALTRDEKIHQVAGSILCTIKSEVVDKINSGEFGLSSDSQKRIIATRLLAYNNAQAVKAAKIKEFEDKLIALTFKPVWTLSYTNKRESDLSDYSTVKMLFEKKIAEKLNWTANAGFSFYHKPNATLNQKQTRDFAVAFSFERLLNRSPFLSESDDKSPITLSFTGNYQRLFENKGLADKKADIGAAQFKLIIPVFAGLSFPLSVTYSNATAESRKDGVRANFGITLDTDKVFQILKLKKLKAQ